jgi:hypothetical protein
MHQQRISYAGPLRKARFNQFTSNLQKSLEDLAKGRLAKATGVPQVTVPVEQFGFPAVN